MLCIIFVKSTATFRLALDFELSHWCVPEVESTATVSQVNSLRSKNHPRQCGTKLSKSTWCNLCIAESRDLPICTRWRFFLFALPMRVPSWSESSSRWTSLCLFQWESLPDHGFLFVTAQKSSPWGCVYFPFPETGKPKGIPKTVQADVNLSGKCDFIFPRGHMVESGDPRNLGQGWLYYW